MKKLFLIILIAFVCMHGFAQNISADRASDIAGRFVSQMPIITRNDITLERVWDSSVLSEANVTRGIVDEAPTFYTFSIGKCGFVIVAGEEVKNPIIGYSLEGSLSKEIPTGMLDYLAGVDAQIRSKRANSVVTRAAVTDETKLGKEVVNLNTAKWGQHGPFNKLCFTNDGRQALTGCVPTAFAIVMRHHKWPDCGEGRIGYSPDGKTVEYINLGHLYDWDKMPLDYSKGYTEEQADAVAVVMRDLGRAYGVTYGVGATDGYPNAEKMSTYFKYVELGGTGMTSRNPEIGGTGEEMWVRLIKESLENGCPIPYQADNSGTASDARHIFVLDGYTDNGYYHFNWGWNGNCNGYFTLDNMDPTSGDQYAGSRKLDHKAIFNLRPKRETTAINETITDENINKTIYDLAGRKVNEISHPGIYIINGKKVVK